MSLCSHGIELTVSLHSIPGLIAWMTKFKLKVRVAQSHVQLFATPWTIQSNGILQARILFKFKYYLLCKFKLKRPAKRSGELGYPALVFLLLLSKELILLHFKSVCQNPKYYNYCICLKSYNLLSFYGVCHNMTSESEMVIIMTTAINI